MIKRFALAAAALAMAGTAHANTVLAVNGGTALANNGYYALPVAKFSYGTAIDYTFSTATNEEVTLFINSVRYEASGVPEVPGTPVGKNVTCKVYSGSPTGSSTYLYDCTTYGGSAIGFVSAVGGQSYYVEMGNADLAPNVVIGGSADTYK